MTKLECPSCFDCSTITEWNEANLGAVGLGLMDKMIPESITEEEWVATREQYGNHMDCPSCGAVCAIADIDAP